MQKFLLFFAVFAALATNSAAQSTSVSVPVAMQIGGGSDIDDFTRPRLVDVKAAAVRSSVILNTAAAERTAFELINEKRAAYGLRPLVWNKDIAEIARVHSENMAEFRFFSHRGLDNKMVSDRADDHGSRKWRSIGENIAYNRGYQDPVGKAVDLWLDSPSHRRNMLDGSWTESAVGVAVAPDGSYYFTQVFWVRK